LQQQRMIGTTISHYRILEQLGQGGMGIVYKAEDTRLHRLVALKFLPPQMSGNEDAKQRFMQEARAASALDHANICSIFDIGEAPVPGSDATQLFIVMAFYDGQTLKYRLQEGALPVAECVDIGSQLASGLQRAHAAGIVHRDMKPANIMVTDHGEVKILDFGVAKLAGGLELTQTGSTLGTAAYMSPEQARNESVDHRTDLWSLGIILYEMMTGRRPFEGDYDAAIAYAILNEAHPPIKTLRPEVPHEVAAVVDELLQKDPSNRYQSAAELSAVLEDVRASSGGSAGKDERRVKRSGWTKAQLFSAAAALSAVILVAIVGLFLNYSGGVDGQPAPATSSGTEQARAIAVLPFTDLSPGRDHEYIGDGIAEELMYGLSKLKDLRVAARSSTFYFKDKNEDIGTIAEQLSVDLVLEGSVRRDGDNLRVTAELVNAADGFQLWSERYDRRIDDVFAVQEDITRSIVDALQIELTGAESSRLSQHGTENLAAYTLYLQGRQQWNSRTEEGLGRSVDLFQQAIELDPDYARAYAGLADALTISADWGHLPALDAFERGREAAETAVRIDPDLAEGYVALAMIHGQFDRRLESAKSLFEKALSLDPDYATGHQWFAEMLQALGEYDASGIHLRRALELDPLSPIINASQPIPYVSSRDFQEALRWSKRSLEVFPDFDMGRFHLSWSYFGLGDRRQALEEADKCQLIDCLGLSAMILALDGNDVDARAILLRIEEIDGGSISPIGEAWAHIGLGEYDAAFELLNEAAGLGNSYLNYFAWTMYDPIRNDPRFRDLLTLLGYP
jgi:serine/threonine-protein kinase